MPWVGASADADPALADRASAVQHWDGPPVPRRAPPLTVLVSKEVEWMFQKHSLVFRG